MADMVDGVPGSLSSEDKALLERWASERTVEPFRRKEKIALIGRLMTVNKGEIKIKEMAQAFGVSQDTLSQHVREWENRQRPVIQEKIRAGETTHQIMEETGVRFKTVVEEKEFLQSVCMPEPTRVSAPYVLAEGEEYVNTIDGVPYFRGGYGKDVPKDRVLYSKNADGKINYRKIYVDGASIETLAKYVVDVCRAVVLVGSAPLFWAIDSSEAINLQQAGLIINRVGTELRCTKAGSKLELIIDEMNGGMKDEICNTT